MSKIIDIYKLVLCTAAVEAAVNQVSLMVGQNGTLSCEMYGYLRESIEWLKDGQQLQSGGRYSITVRNGSREGQNGGQSSVSSVVSQLTIQQVQEGDEGTYTCRAVGSGVQAIISVSFAGIAVIVCTNSKMLVIIINFMLFIVSTTVTWWTIASAAVGVMVVILVTCISFACCCIFITCRKNRRISSSTQWTPSAVNYETSNVTIISENPVYMQKEETFSVESGYIELHPIPTQGDQDTVEVQYDNLHLR